MNVLKTGVLMALLSVLLVAVGFMVGGFGGMIVFFIISALMNFGAYWYSDKLALAMTRAHPVSEKDTPQLYRIVDHMAAKMKMPMPKVYMIESDSPNAFATGRSPKHASIAVTAGIYRLLDEEELEGVLAHEFSHIRNRDILIMTVAATIAGAMTMLANWLSWSLFFGGSGGRGRRNNAAPLVGMMVAMIVAPIAAMVIKLAISRSREYQADETGARVGGNPLALAQALEKLEAASKSRPLKVSEGVSHLFIVNPLSGRTLAGLFSTHPPIAERVRRLREMAGVRSDLEARLRGL